MDKKKRCEHIKSDGERCTMTSHLVDTNVGLLCIWHDPKRADEASEMRRRGQAKQQKHRRVARTSTVDIEGAPPAPQTLDDVVTWGSWVTLAVATGRLDAKTADVVVRALTGLRSALEKQSTEAEVRELRAQLDALRPKGA